MKRAMTSLALLALLGCSDPQDRPIDRAQLERMWALSNHAPKEDPCAALKALEGLKP